MPKKVEKKKNASPVSKKKAKDKSCIYVNYDVGFTNKITIRGNSAGLNWDSGKELKNISASEWVWETDADFDDCEFKVLINDSVYEIGENHHITKGQQLRLVPRFS